MNQTQSSFQQDFFSRLAVRFGSRKEMVEGVSSSLHLGRDAAYRRIRGDTALSAEELIVLARKYDVRVERGRAATTEGDPTMRFPIRQINTSSPINYFESLRSNLLEVDQLTDCRVDYATPELPLFYELGHPNYRTFKIMAMNRTMWNLKEWSGTKFSPNLIDPRIHNICQDIVELSFRQSGREVWSIGVLDISLRQLRYMVEIGEVTVSTAELIIQDLHDILSHMETMARAGHRFLPGESPESTPHVKYRVYHNEMSNTSSMILIRSEETMALYTTLMNPHFMITQDERLCNYASEWFERVIANANALTPEAGKYISVYFNRMREQVDQTRNWVTRPREII